MARLGFRGRRIALIGLLLLPLLAFGVSVAHTEWLRRSFERQFWQDTHYPGAELLGAAEGTGKLVQLGKGGQAAHCDFMATGVYGTEDDYEAVEAYYQQRTLTVDGAAVALDVQPVSDEALSGQAPRSGARDADVRDALRRTGADVSRARSYPTVYVVQAVSWGHPAWLDWRCR